MRGSGLTLPSACLLGVLLCAAASNDFEARKMAKLARKAISHHGNQPNLHRTGRRSHTEVQCCADQPEVNIAEAAWREAPFVFYGPTDVELKRLNSTTHNWTVIAELSDADIAEDAYTYDDEYFHDDLSLPFSFCLDGVQVEDEIYLGSNPYITFFDGSEDYDDFPEDPDERTLFLGGHDTMLYAAYRLDAIEGGQQAVVIRIEGVLYLDNGSPQAEDLYGRNFSHFITEVTFFQDNTLRVASGKDVRFRGMNESHGIDDGDQFMTGISLGDGDWMIEGHNNATNPPPPHQPGVAVLYSAISSCEPAKTCDPSRADGVCDATAYCEEFGWGPVCLCPEGSVGDGYAKRHGGSGCSRESWSVRATIDLGSPRLTAGGTRLYDWKANRSAYSALLLPADTSGVRFDASMHHTVTDGRYITINALFAARSDADAARQRLLDNIALDPPFQAFGINMVPAAFTSLPDVYAFVSRTSDAELQIPPTGMDVQNVYFQSNCMASGCWAIDLIYTVGRDNFNVFYLPRAVGNDTLSFDFDYTAVPAYGIPYQKSPADTFVPQNFPCGSDGYSSKAASHIPDRVSACCIEEFTEMYRPLDSFTADPRIAKVLGPNRSETCGGPTLCALENATCECVGRVRYGANGRYVYQESEGAIECSNQVFGDPAEGVTKNCSCSPRRPQWSALDMPESALVGNFSGMDGLARVDFKSVEDPYIGQYTATVYVDERALRQRAGVLSGTVGVAYAIDTFIGFANFKPTGLEFLDMFAAQTNIHLEKSNFFTVAAFGEMDHTFLEYVNLRLVAIYEQQSQFVDTLPYSFDQYHLTAEFDDYPPSPATGNGTLGAGSRVWITAANNGGYTVSYYLTGLASSETSGGLHVHTGTSCETHEQVFGHYFTTPLDPWTTTWTKQVGSTVAQGQVRVDNPGFGLESNVNHAFVVHEQSGARIACGVLYEVQAGLSRTSPHNAAHYLQVTFTLKEPKYQPIESGIIPIDSVLVSKGDFISSPQTLDTRFHACSQYYDGTFPELDVFKSRFPTQTAQTCAPNASMCYNPPHVPDQFVSFNVPLGVDWLPAPSNNLDSNIFVDMVVSVIDSYQIQQPGAFPNQGAPAEQMKTTLKASIPVVDGGIYIFCDQISVKDDLSDVASVDLILGSAGYEHELSRLTIFRNLGQNAAGDANASRIDTDSIEAGLMTLVIKGNESYFANNFALELEDLITIHVMESPSGTVYNQVLALLRQPGEPLSGLSGVNDDGYDLNGAFRFIVDVAQNRARLHPTSELNQLCPFSPQRPNPLDVFPSTCVSRRDVEQRGFPAAVGKNATAIELPAATVALDDPEREGVARFMQLVLNPSDYSAQLGRNFSYIVGQKYQLNERYNRAFWINPGYEWTPQQTGGQEIFTLSQKIVMFALINLNEGFVGRRRMLLQSTSPTENTGAGVSAQEMTFSTSPQSLMASLFKVPEALVATFEVEMQLTEEQVCLGETDLRRALRSTLDEYAGVTTTNHETVQLLRMVVDRADVECGGLRRLGRRQLSFSSASARLELMVVFSPSDYIAINLEKFASMPGISAISALQLSSVIEVSTADSFPPSGVYSPFDPADGDTGNTGTFIGDPTLAQNEDDSQSGGIDFLVIGICAGAAVLVLGIGMFVFYRWRVGNEPREVQVLQTLKIEELRSELVLP